VDLKCFQDLDPFATELDDPLSELDQDVFHILVEPPGSNIDDIDRGIGIEEALSGRLDPMLARRIEAQLQRDERIDVARCLIEPDGTVEGHYRIDIEIEANTDVLGISFAFDGTVLRKAS
jgi:hypothetical protein